MKTVLFPSNVSSHFRRCLFLLLAIIASCVDGFTSHLRVVPRTITRNGISQILQVSPILLPSHYDTNNVSRRTSITARYAAEHLAEPTLDVTESSSSSSRRRQLARGLLLSSFSDGLVPNPQVIDFFMDSLVESMWNQYIAVLQQKVESSALASPCCGPTDIDSFNQLLDAVDDNENDTSKSESAGKSSSNSQWKAKFEKLLEQQQDELELRFVYIPTAMYALRKDSNNSPGKQRQRARQDGKKRRNQIVQLIQDQFAQAYSEMNHADSKDEEEESPSPVNILTITLDLDDDSLKQPEGSKDASKFPSTGKEALQDWKPNLIYVQGGNTFWLYHCMEKGDYRDALIDAITLGNDDDDDNSNPSPTALYCGTSAGAILAGSLMETATWKGWDDPTVVPDRPNYEDWNGIPGLDLMGENISLFPHMSETWQDMVDGRMENLKNAASNSSDSSSGPSSEVYCLRDDQALCIDGSGLEPSRTLLECSTTTLAEE